MALRLLRAGEQAGNPGYMMERSADFYDEVSAAGSNGSCACSSRADDLYRVVDQGDRDFDIHPAL